MPASKKHTFGTLELPENVQKHVDSLCAELAIDGTKLFCKWEAWMLTHGKTEDIPDITDLNQIAASIRTKVAERDAAPQGQTPRSSRQKSATPLFPARQAPPAVNIDDFFSYFDETPLPEAEPAGPDQGAEGGVQNASDNPFHDRRGPLPREQEQELAAGGSPARAQSAVGVSITDDKLPGDDTADEAYARRAGSGRVEASFDGSGSAAALVQIIDSDVDMTSSKTMSTSRLGLELIDSFWPGKRYMNDMLSARVENLRARVITLGAAILDRVADANSLDGPPSHSPKAFSEASPNPIYVYGRVIVEPDGPGGISVGRLNAKSVALESSDGHIVRLNLSRLEENKRPVFMNPGMVVVVYGVNTNGREIDVHAIYDNCLSPISDSMKKDAMVDDPEDETKFVDIITAAGPYTTVNNLKYEPLDDLLRVVERNKPALVVLAGPFVDVRHSLVSDTLTVPYEKLFFTRVLNRISDCLKRLREEDHECNFIIIPSLEDAHQPFVCPQPPMSWPRSMPGCSEAGITLTSNPVFLKITAGNHCATIGATSLPTVWDISSDSICWNMDKMQGISSHLVKQRSFYPMFPPTANIPLDSTLMQGLEIPSGTDEASSVNLLLAPARLKGFVKLAEAGVLVVNSGLLCRGSGGGTYAEIRLPLHQEGRARVVNLNEKYANVKVVRL